MQFKITAAMVTALLCTLPSAFARSLFSNQGAMQSSHGRLDLAEVNPSTFGTFSMQACWRMRAHEKPGWPKTMEAKRFGSCWTCCLIEKWGRNV
ncbi:hypothetical protein HGRIS_000049 [Hohenbuehelia grisea]|uniref:Secreted protein n=1 Tax=Hohenbuehelia grisea TaxID=104357 RepID=A0ABR3JRQ6_9AGAR